MSRTRQGGALKRPSKPSARGRAGVKKAHFAKGGAFKGRGRADAHQDAIPERSAAPSRGSFRASALDSDGDVREDQESAAPLESEDSDTEAVRRWTSAPASESEEESPVSEALPVLAPGREQWTHRRVSAPSTTRSDASDDSDGAQDTEEPEAEPADDVRESLAKTALAMTEAAEGPADPAFGTRVREIAVIAENVRAPVAARALALATLATVLRDMMPGYRVRAVSAAERSAPVSREVRAQRAADDAFLAAYARLVAMVRGAVLGGVTKVSGASVRWRPHKSSMRPLTRTAVAALCEMLVSGAHFNQHDELARTAVAALVRHAADSDVVERLCAAFGRLFAEEITGGEATLRVVSQLSAAAQQTKPAAYECPAAWLLPLSRVRISDASPAASRPDANSEEAQRAPGEDLRCFKRRLERRANARKHMSARERREDKERAASMLRMAAAEAVVSTEERARWHKDTLRHLFRIYFGVLCRVRDASAASQAPKNGSSSAGDERLAIVLEGVARHARRIDTEHFCGLLQALRALLAAPAPGMPERLDVAPAMHCIVAVERMHALAESLAGIDLRVFHASLFRQLRVLGTTAVHNASWANVEDPITAALHALYDGRRREDVSATRVAAVAQRLADVACAVWEASSIPLRERTRRVLYVIERVAQILGAHPGVAVRVLDAGDETSGTDVVTAVSGPWAYDAAAADPDACNALRRPLWPVLESLAERIGDKYVTTAVRALLKIR